MELEVFPLKGTVSSQYSVNRTNQSSKYEDNQSRKVNSASFLWNPHFKGIRLKGERRQGEGVVVEGRIIKLQEGNEVIHPPGLVLEVLSCGRKHAPVSAAAQVDP